MVYKGLLVSLNEGIGKEAKELLLLLAMDNDKRAEWYTSDGSLRFAGLIVAGLVRAKAGWSAAMPGDGRRVLYPWPGQYRVELTERGNALVAAWKAGDPEALRVAQALIQP
ncbi:MAG TPA: hypothetical protein VMB73_13780 [Acetobacteraceae bacterium]|nr:hypothetical protein [Acetobacteraceae bacterium]